jgi:hypothetical protein
VSNYDKTVFFHLLIAERPACADLRPPKVERAQRLGLIDVEDEDDGIHSTEKMQMKGMKSPLRSERGSDACLTSREDFVE